MTASLTWFARHEIRLAWRDFFAMLTAGRPGRERSMTLGVIAFFVVLHGVALLVLRAMPVPGIHPDLATMIAVTSAMLLSGSAMLSQAMESVTRAFYSRSDLELILSSPAPAARMFAVRIGAIALSTSAMSLVITAPFIDVLVWRDGWRWLGAYGALCAMALIATASAVLLTLALFRAIGPRRTRFAAQVVAAVVGAGFVIGIQIAAMLSTGSLSRAALFRSPGVIAHAPGIDSAFWWPARAALGDSLCLVGVLATSLTIFFLVTIRAAPRFAGCALAAGSVARDPVRISTSRNGFRARRPDAALRRKEWLLLRRDPWLMSQSLMQLLYLLPPALLLWKSFAIGNHASAIAVPVLIMASGQLAGGLAWLAISGEDAPDLVASAPVLADRILRAKIEAVMCAIALVFAPFVFILAFAAPAHAIIAGLGITASAISATAIQLWFRSQAKRSHFRRRHTSSRIATFAEAFSSISWAATGAIAAAGSPLAVVMALIALAVLLLVRRFAPSGAEPVPAGSARYGTYASAAPLTK
jgi:ABC-2 type transport system permease protein